MEKDIAEKYNAFVSSKGNAVWVGTMGLCWNNFAETYKQKEFAFATNNGNALKTISNFNQGAFSRKDIDEASIYVKTGMGP
jgi:hypothetical protein